MEEEIIDEVQITKEDDLVDLIYMPAWKMVLLDVIKKEKFDIWNIDISLLAEKYLGRIRLLQDSNLRIPANAILASAILLRFKSKTIRLSSIEEEDDLLAQSQANIFQFDGFIPELTVTGKIRTGNVSLDDLVNSIEEILDKTSKKALNAKPVDKPEFLLNLTSVDWDKKIADVFDSVLKNADSQGLVLFSNLVNRENVDQLVEIFLSLLFLAGQHKVALFQEDFFGEIFINVLN